MNCALVLTRRGGGAHAWDREQKVIRRMERRHCSARAGPPAAGEGGRLRVASAISGGIRSRPLSPVSSVSIWTGKVSRRAPWPPAPECGRMTLNATEQAVLSKIARLRHGGTPRVLDLFAGCGGLSLGFKAAGFDIAAAVELDPEAAASHGANFHPGDPRHAVARDITKARPGRARTGGGARRRGLRGRCHRGRPALPGVRARRPLETAGNRRASRGFRCATRGRASIWSTSTMWRCSGRWRS